MTQFHLKFTKGNITVNNKDAFIQKSHIARLVREMDPDSFLHLFLPGLETGITRIEKERVEHVTQNGTAYSVAGTKIGPLVPSMRTREDSDATDTKDYIRKVLALDYKSYRNPDTYLERNIYLLWQVPELVHFESLEEGMHDLDGLIYRDVQQAASEHSRDVLQQPSQLATKLRDIVLCIDEAEWSRDHIDGYVTPFIKSIFSKPKASPPASQQVWGFHFLRWVLAGLRPGPALIPTLELLGREETVKRVEQAIEVASRWEKRQGQE